MTNRSLITQVSGECIVYPTRADPNPVQPDSVILEYTRNHDMLVEGDVGPPGLDQFWNDLTIKGEGTGQRVLEIFSVRGIGSAKPYQEDNLRKTITTSKLTLDNVDLEANVIFKFDQLSNTLTFKDSKVYWHTRDPIFQSGMKLTVTSETGSNQWKGMAGTTIPADIDWNIKNGTTFEFFGAGAARRALSFTGQNRLNIEAGATLKFHESVLDFGSNSVLTLDPGSTLGFRTSETIVTFDTLNADGATLAYEGGAISFLPTTANLNDTTVNLVSGNLETRRLVLSGRHNTVTGDRSVDYLRAEVIQTKDTSSPTILNATHLNQIRAETLLLTPNLTINLDRASLRMLTGSDLRLQGGLINVDNPGVIGEFGQITGNDATINIDNGDFVVGETTELVLGPSLIFL
ncbi:MAG: hypothetical protein MK096_00220 [Oleiphilaceae bacterium]|nr:hypothetical protein [Oleiphilaceae bacterium]